MKNMNKDKVAFLACLVASICFYVSAIIGMSSGAENWVVNFCLGSAMLCLSTTHLNKEEKEEEK